MVKEDLIERSAVRNFEKALDGALQPGEIGIVTAKRGVGKTSMLVQLGLDQLLQGKPIVHISFSQQTDYEGFNRRSAGISRKYLWTYQPTSWYNIGIH